MTTPQLSLSLLATYGVQAYCKSFQGSKRLSFLVMRELQMDSIYKGIEPAIAALIAIA